MPLGVHVPVGLRLRLLDSVGECLHDVVTDTDQLDVGVRLTEDIVLDQLLKLGLTADTVRLLEAVQDRVPAHEAVMLGGLKEGEGEGLLRCVPVPDQLLVVWVSVSLQDKSVPDIVVTEAEYVLMVLLLPGELVCE